MKKTNNWKSGPPQLQRRYTDYPTDLAEHDWLTVRPLLPRVMRDSHNRKIDLRNIMDAISFWAINNVAIQKLPEDLPRPGTVHYFCFRFAHDGTFKKIFQALGDEHPLVQGLKKKMRSFQWIGTSEDEAHRHNQYKV